MPMWGLCKIFYKVCWSCLFRKQVFKAEENVCLYKTEHMEIFIAVKCYSTAKQTWKNKTGVNRARGSPSLKVLGWWESTDRTHLRPPWDMVLLCASQNKGRWPASFFLFHYNPGLSLGLIWEIVFKKNKRKEKQFLFELRIPNKYYGY